MKYYVESFIIASGMFGVKRDKMDQQLAAKLNALAEQGFEIVSVIELGDGGRDFSYQIIYRK